MHSVLPLSTGYYKIATDVLGETFVFLSVSPQGKISITEWLKPLESMFYLTCLKNCGIYY